MAKGKTPSLIGSSLGRPNKKTCGRETPCSRCHVGIAKTALLQAIYRLRPIVGGDAGYSVTDDYPRRDVPDYEHDIEQGEREHAVVARLTFELDDADVAAVTKTFGEKALTSRTLTINRYRTASLQHLTP